MIDEGLHREAQLWVAFGYLVARLTLALDAPEPEQADVQARWERLVADHGFATPAGRHAHVLAAEEITTQIVELAEGLGSGMVDGAAGRGADARRMRRSPASAP